MRYLRMLSNSVVAASVATAYVLILVALVNPALRLDPSDLTPLAATVGLYYLVRSMAITPAAAIGGLLWKLSPQTPFAIAGIFGVAGTFIFIATVRERSQSA